MGYIYCQYTLNGKLCQHELPGYDLLRVRFWPLREYKSAHYPVALFPEVTFAWLQRRFDLADGAIAP